MVTLDGQPWGRNRDLMKDGREDGCWGGAVAWGKRVSVAVPFWFEGDIEMTRYEPVRTFFSVTCTPSSVAVAWHLGITREFLKGDLLVVVLVVVGCRCRDGWRQ